MLKLSERNVKNKVHTAMNKLSNDGKKLYLPLRANYKYKPWA